MALKPCKECGQQISTAARSCPQCGAPKPTTAPQNKRANIVLGAIGVVVLIGVFGRGSEDSKNSSAASSTTSAYSPASSSPAPTSTRVALPTNPAVALPPQEQGFIDIVDASRRSYSVAANDMAKGSMRPARARSICGSMRGTSVTDWVGTVTTLSSNSDGDGVLGIEIAKDITLKTWNNSFSDISDNTILHHSSTVYRQAQSMSVGQKVRFSGNFIKQETDCFKESSVTMHGSMTDPEFVFRFTALERL